MNEPTPGQKIPEPENQGPLIIILTVIITAIIVGGGIYLWQNTSAQKIIGRAKNNEQTLSQQIDKLKSSLTNISEEKIKEVKNILKNSKEIYFQNTTVGLKIPTTVPVNQTIIPHYYELAGGIFDLYLVGKSDEVLGHPLQKNLTAYCQNNYFKTTNYHGHCQESLLDSHRMVTIFEAANNQEGDNGYVVSKIILIETNITDYPILILNYQKLPDYILEKNVDIETILNLLVNTKTEDLPPATQYILNDLDFIMNNIDWKAPLGKSTIPAGYIMENDRTTKGGQPFTDTTPGCGGKTDYGLIYDQDGQMRCCKI